MKLFSSIGLLSRTVLLLSCRDVRRAPVLLLLPRAGWAGEMRHLCSLKMGLRHVVGCRVFTDPLQLLARRQRKTLPA